MNNRPLGDLTDDALLEIYRATKTIAVVGATNTPGKAGYRIPTYLKSLGYQVIPVNPRDETVVGERAYPSLRDIPTPVDVVDVFRPPGEAMAVARDAIDIHAKVLWFQPETEDAEALKLAAAAGLTVVAGRCMGNTHRDLGLGPGPEPAPEQD